MPALKMDGTVRRKRQPKRATKDLPFHWEIAFSRAWQDGLAARDGKPVKALSFDAMTPGYVVAGYNAGRTGASSKEAFAVLQKWCAANGFHRD